MTTRRGVVSPEVSRRGFRPLQAHNPGYTTLRVYSGRSLMVGCHEPCARRLVRLNSPNVRLCAVAKIWGDAGRVTISVMSQIVPFRKKSRRGPCGPDLPMRRFWRHGLQIRKKGRKSAGVAGGEPAKYMRHSDRCAYHLLVVVIVIVVVVVVVVVVIKCIGACNVSYFALSNAS